MRLDYDKHYKHVDIEASYIANRDKTASEGDPRIQYMKQCSSNLNLVLPIFDKVINKTLCL